jgi:hypothetical protein
MVLFLPNSGEGSISAHLFTFLTKRGQGSISCPPLYISPNSSAHLFALLANNGEGSISVPYGCPHLFIYCLCGEGISVHLYSRVLCRSTSAHLFLNPFALNGEEY